MFVSNVWVVALKKTNKKLSWPDVNGTFIWINGILWQKSTRWGRKEGFSSEMGMILPFLNYLKLFTEGKCTEAMEWTKSCRRPSKGRNFYGASSVSPIFVPCVTTTSTNQDSSSLNHVISTLNGFSLNNKIDWQLLFGTNYSNTYWCWLYNNSIKVYINLTQKFKWNKN